MLLPFLLVLLKILGLILLSILGFALLIVMSILFIPFVYRINAQKFEKISGLASVSWLFGILRVVYEAENSKGCASVRLFGLTVWREKKPDANNAAYNSKNKKRLAVDNSEAVRAVREEAKPARDTQGSFASGGSRQSEDEYVKAQKPQTDEGGRSNKRKGAAAEKRRPSKAKKKKANKAGAFEKLKRIWEYENKSEILEQAILLAKRLIKAVTGFRVWAKLRIGTGQPHSTGYLIGLLWAASGVSGIDISAEGDYENKTLSGKASIKGRLFFCSIVWAILLFVFNKHIFPIIKRIIFKKG